MRKVTTMIMTRVAAMVMRMTVFTRPGYGAISHRMNSRNQSQEPVRRAGWWWSRVAGVAISRLLFVSADNYYCRFPQTNGLRRRRLNPDADGVAAGQVYPAQSALYVGKAWRDSALERRIGCNTVPDALDDARKSQSGIRHNVDVRSHARLDMLQLRLSEIRNYPPDASVD